MVDLIKARFDCVLFDLGNTLIKQENPGVPYESLSVELLPGVEQLLKELHGQVKLGIVSNTQTITASDIKKKLATVGIDHYFDVVIATGELGIHKPESAPINAAIQALDAKADYVLTDGYSIPGLSTPNLAVWKGDQVAITISAASILAKVYRDRIMIELDKKYPLYGLANHKGYITASHTAAIKEFGVLPIHRKSFANIAAITG